MHSRLETIPHDILQLIAFMAASPGTFDAPVAMQRLLMTSSTIYQALNVRSAPHLYSQVFCSKFDTGAVFRRYTVCPAGSTFATELSNRFRLLRRACRRDLSPNGLFEDLWTALRMVLESDGMNEAHLARSNFGGFILALARSHLLSSFEGHKIEIQGLNQVILWLLCLTLRQATILNLSAEHRNELYALIYPFMFSSNVDDDLTTIGDRPFLLRSAGPPGTIESRNGSFSTPPYVTTRLNFQSPLLPDPSYAAMNLAFIMFESTPPRIPPHLPENRAIANATQRSGPTKADYRIMHAYRTPLFADGIAENHGGGFSRLSIDSRSTKHDLEFGQIFGDTGSSRDRRFFYVPGAITGVWEGIYRTANRPTNLAGPLSTASEHPFQIADTVFVKPIQCAIKEYISIDRSGIPPEEIPDDSLSSIAVGEKVPSFRVNEREYKEYVPSDGASNGLPYLDVADVMVFGETLEDHDQAWGGFKFYGRIHNDGLIVLFRKPKVTADIQGTWRFEGRLQFGTVLLGRWRVTGTSDSSQHGIFSLGKGSCEDGNYGQW